MDQHQTFSRFFSLCRTVEEIMEREWNDSEEWERQKRLEMEKGAIMGHEKETCFYKTKIQNILKGRYQESDMIYPPWYRSLAEGVFAELYGLSGLTPWAYDETEEYKNSSSAKLIGDRM